MSTGSARRFDWFVVLAGMRTGSNLLEAHLNSAEGVACHGEVFNPHFIGSAKRTRLFGIEMAARDANPEGLISKLRQQPGLNGFRLFHDHDPRVLPLVLADPRCAKIVLTRSPLMSYLSLGQARSTGQWRLGETKDRKETLATLDPIDFANHVRTQAEFQHAIRAALIRSGQAACYIDYDDLSDLAAINGLLGFLGAPPLANLSDSILRQNPVSPEDRVPDPAQLAKAIAAVDWGGLGFVPATEPKRGPQVPSYLAARGAPVLFIPVPGVQAGWAERWLERLGPSPAGIESGFTQKTLRSWMKDRASHRAFTVVGHPVNRAFSAFGRALAGSEDIRRAIATEAGMAEADLRAGKLGGLTTEVRHDLFLAFLRLVRLTIEGRTRLKLPPDWASQSEHIAGFSSFRAPDLIVRAEQAAEMLARLAADCKAVGPRVTPALSDPSLAEIMDASVDAAAQAAYGRDYANFGFGAWSPQAA